MDNLAGHASAIGFRRMLAGAVALVVVIGSFFATSALDAATDLEVGPYEYNIAAWETRNFADKWLFAFGALFRDDPSVAEQDAISARFFALTREIDALEQRLSAGDDPATRAELEAKEDERDRLENQVEATIEARLTMVLEREGLTRSLLINNVVWPPVDFEFTAAPRMLATSPRERIELTGTTLLEADLDLATIERIEAEKEAGGRLSSLAFPTGGVGAYPAIVAYTSSYRTAVEITAHEWTHNYLFFQPLGFNYYDNYEVRALNETVADLVGREVAAAVFAEWPQAPGEAPAGGSVPAVDVGAELRALRPEVDALLAAGRIEEAEALMEQKRRELVERGVRLRKLNQAYFAFTNLYAGEAGNPAATNPIGPKVDELRRRSASLSEFVDRAGELTSVAELDEALAEAP